MRLSIGSFIRIGLVSLITCIGVVNAQDNVQDKPDDLPQITSVKSSRDMENVVPFVRLHDRLIVSVSNAEKLDHPVQLYFNGNKVPIGDPQFSGEDSFEFEIDNLQNEDAREFWKRMLGELAFKAKEVSITIGTPKLGEIKQAQRKTINLVVIHKVSFWIWIVAMITLLIVLYRLAVDKNMLREWGTQEVNSGKKNRYSLGRWQMAFWFYFVVGAFSFIWMVTDLTDTITSSMVILMGISSATAVGATIIDSTKKSTAVEKMVVAKATIAKNQNSMETVRSMDFSDNVEKIAMAREAGQLRADTVAAADSLDGLAKEASASATRKFLNDILSDESGNFGLHRVQIFIWTWVMAIIFVSRIFHELAMPDFSETILGLMGVSSGTYLGFKLPEKK